MIQKATPFLWFLLLMMAMNPRNTLAASGTFDRIEASFQLRDLNGNPFDSTRNDVRVTIDCPNNRQVVIPAFFDGDHTWRVRHTPDAAGNYSIRSITRNAQEAHAEKLDHTQFDISGLQHPGFVAIDTDHHRFIRSDGSPYYPVGYNLAWHMAGGSMPPITESLARMGAADLNWTRIWMSSWDGKNLDWAINRADQPPIGELSLKSARLWDQIVDAADANHICFQLVLQHHGQFSSHADTNWSRNPWNKTNGGWLENPAQFFSDPKAIALTRGKYRYIIARWGYSPSIMAWELFNEVESTDGFKSDPDAVAKWHADMAAFLREQDPYHHLITTSSWTTEPKLWPAMDYFQAHVYPPDILSSIANLDDQHLDRPYFYGEIGTIDGLRGTPDETIRQLLWGSLMSQSNGAAQYWSWDIVESQNLFPRLTAVQKFIRQSGMLTRPDMKPIQAIPQTADLGPLTFGPALGWARSTSTKLKPRPDGAIERIGGMAAYLQGTGKNHDMFPDATFDVDYPAAGSFAVRVDQVTAKGAKLLLSVDSQPAATLDLAAGPDGAHENLNVDATLTIPVLQGKHSIHLENSGQDWIRIRDFTLTPYAPQLGVLAKGDAHSAIVWVYRRALSCGDSITGTLQIPGLSPGNYHLVWCDTDEGKIVKEEQASVTVGQPLTVSTPPIAKDLALWIDR